MRNPLIRSATSLACAVGSKNPLLMTSTGSAGRSFLLGDLHEVQIVFESGRHHIRIGLRQACCVNPTRLHRIRFYSQEDYGQTFMRVTSSNYCDDFRMCAIPDKYATDRLWFVSIIRKRHSWTQELLMRWGRVLCGDLGRLQTCGDIAMLNVVGSKRTK